MTRFKDDIERVERFVVFFDICSSTAILEDILRTGNERRWRNLLIDLKVFVRDHPSAIGFEIYKFLGDGWVLLLDKDRADGAQFMNFLTDINARYRQSFEERIGDILDQGGYPVGITFGVDCGTLVSFVMNEQTEYVGRAINVAARLQGAVKGIAKGHPEGRVLMSKTAYAELRLADEQRYLGQLVEVNLRNVTGGEAYTARKIILPEVTTSSGIPT